MKHKALLKGMLAAFLVTAAVSGTAGKMPVLAAENTQEEIQAYQAEQAAAAQSDAPTESEASSAEQAP